MFKRLTNVGKHHAAHFRCLAGSFHGRDDACLRIPSFRQFRQRQFQIPDHRTKFVIEVVGNGSGHAAQAFGLLKLPVLDFDYCLLLFRLLALGDVVNGRQ